MWGSKFLPVPGNHSNQESTNMDTAKCPYSVDVRAGVCDSGMLIVPIGLHHCDIITLMIRDAQIRSVTDLHTQIGSSHTKLRPTVAIIKKWDIYLWETI